MNLNPVLIEVLKPVEIGVRKVKQKKNMKHRKIKLPWLGF
jgi:hypothetical protein